MASAGSTSAVVHVSATPGTFLGAQQVELRNTTGNGAVIVKSVVNGGFDPVPVTARTGDTIVLSFSAPAVTRYMSVVPGRREPTVVRTAPANGRVDVELSSRPMVVFSEPLDRTGAGAALTLTQSGIPVAGKAQISTDGLTAEFIPDGPLVAAMDYVLTVNPVIRDMDGDALTATTAVAFAAGGFPAGMDLIFSQVSDGEVYRTNGVTTSRMPTPTGSFNASWSPDGNRIAFIKYDGNFGDVYVMNADGSNVVRRTVGLNLLFVAWSADGMKLVASNEGYVQSSIYVMSAAADGVAPALIETAGRSPAWSPDGQRIAFVRPGGEDDALDAILSMKPDGTDKIVLMPPGGFISPPSWSPDSKRLAYTNCPFNGGCDVYSMSATGSDRRQLTTVGTPRDVAWSPDGKWIATSLWFYSPQRATVTLAYLPSSGGTLRPILAGGYHPSWRP